MNTESMRRLLCALVVLTVASSSLSAHGGLARGGIRALRANPTVFKATRTPLSITKAPALMTNETPSILSQRLALEQTLRASVGRVTAFTAFRPADVCDSFSSGTVIADDYGDYWVVLSHHGTHSSLGKPQVEFYVNGQKIVFGAEIIISGSRGYTDLALAKVPEKYKPLLKPIKLMEELPEPGEIGSSYGFGGNKLFHSAHNQEVVNVTPARLTLQFEPTNAPFVGGCGGPFIIGNQIAGFPCGFSASSNKRYMIPSTTVKELINAAHNNGISLTDLKFKGKTIGTINVDQSINEIFAFKGKTMIAHLNNDKKGAFVKYEKLEDTFYNYLPSRLQEEMTDIYFVLSRDNFFTTFKSQPDVVFRQTFLHYNVKTGESQILTSSQKAFFHYFNKLPKGHNK